MWTASQQFLNTEHNEIFDQTKHIPGWQEPGDSHRLYEMAYRAGDVILEIGTYGGRSAVVELRGALANPERTTRPQFFGIDIDVQGIWRTSNTLDESDLSDYALLYHGDLEGFIKEFSIQPTMVFVDGDHRYEGVKRDLKLLSKYLAPGVPVLCHDYLNPENDTGELGVRQAVNEFVNEGYAELIGPSGCSAFLVTSSQCSGSSGDRITPLEFAQRRASLLKTFSKDLYEKWQASEADRAARLDAIHQLQHQLNSTFSGDPAQITAFQPVTKVQQQLERTQAKVDRLQERLHKVKAELDETQGKIAAMESSKFWQLRQKWFRIKQALGLAKKD